MMLVLIILAVLGSVTAYVQLKRISIDDFMNGTAIERAKVVSNLREAFEHEGMALIVDHGVPIDVIEDLMESSRDFFAMTLEMKQKYQHVRQESLPPRSYASPTSPIGRAYSIQAQDDNNQVLNEWLQFRETRNWSIDDEPSYYGSAEGKEHYSHNDEFGLPRDWSSTKIAQVSNLYYKHIVDLTTILNDLFGAALAEYAINPSARQRARKVFTQASRRVPWWPVTVAHYPPTRTNQSQSNERKMRIPAHWDRSLFALIAVDDVDDGRLEILVDAETGQAADARSTNAVWRQIEPLSRGDFVLNSGELMTRWSNGKFKHVVHRVPTPTFSSGEERGRIAVMAYVMPDYDAVVDCVLCDDKEKSLFEPSWVGELTNWGSTLPHYNQTLQDTMRRAQALYSITGTQQQHKMNSLPTDASHVQNMIPTVNISSLFGDEKKFAAQELSAAFEKYGFAIIVGHGVSAVSIHNLREAAYEFFNSEEKFKYDKDQGYGFGGYVHSQESGAQLLGDFSKPIDIVESLSLPGISASEECDSQEEIPPVLQDASRIFLEQTKLVGAALAQALIFGLNVSLSEINQVSDVSASSGLRLAHYWDNPNPLPGQMRYGAHVDSGGLTLLSLDPANPHGLQIYTGTDMETSNPDLWLDVPYVPNSFVVNVGALLSRWTRKSWRAVIHRVVPTPGSRLSIVTSALSPRLDAPAFGAFTPITGDETQPNVHDDDNETFSPVVARDFLSIRAKLHRPTFAQEQGLHTDAEFEQETSRIRALHK